MGVFAAVMTGPGAGAIATIQLGGESARTILQKIFRPQGQASFEPISGRVFLGSIVDADSVIDQVTIGCEARNNYAIHCHGNPLLVERIMELLQRCGVRLLPGEKLLGEILASAEPGNAIAVEAKLALVTARTVDVAKMLAHQIEAGLAATAKRWRQLAESGDLEQIRAEAGEILRHSEAARLILAGCTVALIGPTNTGKSTLLNALAGRDKALVTDTKGTTRDWVSAEIHIPPLAANVIDTAGLDADLATAPEHDVDRMAQAASREVLARADLVLLVLDSSRPACQLDSPLVEVLREKKVVTVLNKSDLSQRLDPVSLPQPFRPVIRISAKHETGIKDLIQAIHGVCHVPGFNPHTPVAFTLRQMRLLEKIRCGLSRTEAVLHTTELLEGTLSL